MSEPLKKPYPEAFKRRAVELLRTSRRPLAQIARELGVSTASLRLWRKQAEIDAGEPEGLSSQELEQPRPLSDKSRVVRTRVRVSLVVAAAVAAAVAFLSLPLGGSSGEESAGDEEAAKAVKADDAVRGTFVGELSGTNGFVAVVAAPAEGEKGSGAVQVYVSDGKRLSEWFSGPISESAFVAKSDVGDAKARGKLNGDSVTGEVELPGGKTASYRASSPSGPAGLYELKVSSAGELRGASANGLGATGEIPPRKRQTGVLRLVDGTRLEFVVIRRKAGDLLRLRAGQIRLIVLPGGKIRGAGKGRPATGGRASDFFIRSSSA
jgi:transposase-like protein